MTSASSRGLLPARLQITTWWRPEGPPTRHFVAPVSSINVWVLSFGTCRTVSASKSSSETATSPRGAWANGTMRKGPASRHRDVPARALHGSTHAGGLHGFLGEAEDARRVGDRDVGSVFATNLDERRHECRVRGLGAPRARIPSSC